MREMEIQLRSVQDVLKFVSLSTAQPFPVSVGTDSHRVNGKSFLEIFSLNFRKPLTVTFQCSDEEFEAFRAAASRFLAI